MRAGHDPSLKFAVLAADTCVFTMQDGELLVRTVAVRRPPHFPDHRGLPGGLLRASESAEGAAARFMREKAHLDPAKMYIEQLATFSDVGRDPRGRVVAVAYLGLVPWNTLSREEQRGADGAQWIVVSNAKKLAYDHDEILAVALKRLRSRITYTTLISKLLPHEFTLTELEAAYASILKTKLDKRNFRKKILKLNILKPLRSKRAGGPFRPAQLYCFASKSVEEIEMV